MLSEIRKEINNYRRRFILVYQENEPLLTEVVRNANIFVDENVTHNGYLNEYGPDLIFYIEENIYKKFRSIEKVHEASTKIEDIFRAIMKPFANEFIYNVFIDLFDSNNENCQNAIQPNDISEISQNQTDNSIWKANNIKLFISHKVQHKEIVSNIAKSLSSYDISSFVAHEDIKPTVEWQSEIEKALRSMDVFLAFLTDDFQEGDWTSQEIGFAVARGVPIIPFKFEKLDPYGFIGNKQALKSENKHKDVQNISKDVQNIRKLIFEKLSGQAIIRTIIINRFIDSPNFASVVQRFHELKKIENFSNDELGKLASAYNQNSQIYDSWYVEPYFFTFLQSKSNNAFKQTDSGKIQRV